MASFNEQAEIVPGQWRLSEVVLYNWGTFNGAHGFAVDRRGLLLTGQSGSGKSTIIDAISTVLTPSAQSNFNAAASNGSRKDNGRSIVSYVRGAFGHASDAGGELASKYLRPRSAVWSAIILRYEDGIDANALAGAEGRQHEPISLFAVFNLKKNSTSDEGLKRFYGYVRGDITLEDLQPYGRDGADMAAFNKDFRARGRAYRSHADFLNAVCSLFHIASSRTFQLLQKTQAAKNIGSLDDLFRRYMLDTPETFAIADQAVEQFQELEQAHQGIVQQRLRMEQLEPLEALDAQYTKARDEQTRLTALDQVSQVYITSEALDVLQRESNTLLARQATLDEALLVAEEEKRSADLALQNAIALLSEQGGMALETTLLQISQGEERCASIRSTRKSLSRELAAVSELELPDSFAQFTLLLKDLEEEVTSHAQAASAHEREKIEAFGLVASLEQRYAELEKELRHLRSQQGNMPRALHAIRSEIAQACGLALADLPFVGELIDVKPDQSSWQGAIERLLHASAQTMLVQKRHIAAVRSYVDAHHLRHRFEYDEVPAECEVPEIKGNPRSLVRKLTVVPYERHPEFSRWVNRMLRTRFDYTCVDTPDELAQCTYGLTQAGQVKAKDHYIKDDRKLIGDKTRWLLGSSNEEKIASLEKDAAQLEQESAKAQRECERIEEKQNRYLLLQGLVERLRQTEWSTLDIDQAEKTLAEDKAFYEQLSQSTTFKELEASRQEAKRVADECAKALDDLRVDKGLIERELEKNAASRHECEERLQGYVERSGAATAEQIAELRTLIRKADKSFDRSVEKVYAAANAMITVLHTQISKQEKTISEAVHTSEMVMQKYKDRWKAETTNLTALFGDRDAYIAQYRQIKATGLPDYEDRFLKVLTEFSRDQITTLASKIRDAYQDVRERLEPVNQSLLLSEYSPGIHLQIVVREARSARVTEFLSELKTITTGLWETNDLDMAEQRYLRTAAVMNRLASSDPADIRWRRECLDTTQHMKFIAEERASDGETVNVHSNDEGLSGGQKQKLVFFCLAAALRYQLSDEEQTDPSYGTVILDEAFDKSDRFFAADALDIFNAFNFHMVLATPGKLMQTIEKYVGSVVLVSADDRTSTSSVLEIPFEDEDGAC